MPSLDSSITTHPNCDITPLITGPAYFAALKAKIDALGTNGAGEPFIYLAGWLFSPTFPLAAGTQLTDLLTQKARAGVDVRVLAWVMAPEMLRNPRVQSAPDTQSMLRLNASTMRFINALRTEPALANKACLNILSHPAGAVHFKMAVVGSANDATGFTGGVDFEELRRDPIWHDVQAQVNGPVVQELFNAYRQMWNEVRGRSTVRLTASGVTCDSHTSGTPDLPSRTITSPSSGHLRVQSVRTIPLMRFSSTPLLASLGGESIPANRPVSFAPSGLFEVKRAWESGIRGAQTYIYMEDQGYTSTEVFDWVNGAIKANDQLQVILLAGRGDPQDPPHGLNEEFFRIAINDHLLAGLGAGQIDRVGLFSHHTKVIHTKTTIVDDSWAIIGSANCMRRSLYTDFEHSVAYMDDDDNAVGAYRADLWGHHLQRSFISLDAALQAWFAIPYPTPGTPPSFGLSRVRLPLPTASLNADERVLYDQVFDVDSRQEWGGPLIQLFMKQHGVGSLSGS